MLGQLPDVAERDAVVPADAGQLVGPAGAGQPVVQVVQVGLRDVDAERPDVVVVSIMADATSPLRKSSFRMDWQTRRNMLETSARLLRLLSLLQTPPRLDRRRAGRAAGRHPADRPQRHRAAARARLSGARHAGRGRRLPAGRGRRAAAAAARRRGGGRRRGRAAHGGRRHGGRHRGDVGARAGEAGAGAARPAAAPGQRAAGATPCRCPAPAPTVDPEMLTALAAACRDRERLRFDYRGHDGDDEPADGGAAPPGAHRPPLVPAWPGTRDREDWRTFRVDRIAHGPAERPRFAAREPPAGDAAAYVAEAISALRDR